MKQIKVTGKMQPRIVDTRAGQPRVDPAMVAKALGAEIVSTGGRPGLAWATRRQKIPLSEADWGMLAQIADAVSASGRKMTPAQVAGTILRDALQGTSDDQVRLWLDARHPGRAFEAACAAIDKLSAVERAELVVAVAKPR